MFKFTETKIHSEIENKTSAVIEYVEVYQGYLVLDTECSLGYDVNEAIKGTAITKYHFLRNGEDLYLMKEEPQFYA